MIVEAFSEFVAPAIADSSCHSSRVMRWIGFFCITPPAVFKIQEREYEVVLFTDFLAA